MRNRVQTLSTTTTGDTMHHHTFVHRRPAHVIGLFSNLFNSSPPTPSWSLVSNPDPTAQAKLRINRNEYALATSCTPDPDVNVYSTADRLSRTLDDTHLDAVDTDYTVFQITLPTDEAIGATRIIDAIAAAHNTSRATASTELLHGTTIVSTIDDNHTVTTVPTGPLAHANLTFDRRLARKTRTRKEHQKLRDTWNYITRFAFQNVGASAIIVEEAPIPF